MLIKTDGVRIIAENTVEFTGVFCPSWDINPNNFKSSTNLIDFNDGLFTGSELARILNSTVLKNKPTTLEDAIELAKSYEIPKWSMIVTGTHIPTHYGYELPMQLNAEGINIDFKVITDGHHVHTVQFTSSEFTRTEWNSDELIQVINHELRYADVQDKFNSICNTFNNRVTYAKHSLN
ncbi:hypothetical protein bcgnr5378_37270 [Bacillus cereus]|uniref:Uncharacterized protein n=1 Tax=Bacillus cereus TaxID=1396 RepID=A0A164QNB5_BACCE|nr:hypothetical protein [Bacillus cereus]KZD71942.1 hypothetical protein B4088_0403 [Bacillus cereus]